MFRQSQQANQGVSQRIHAVNQPQVNVTTQPQVKQGVSQLIHAVNWDGIVDSLDDEGRNWSFLSKEAVQSGGPVQCTEHTKDGSVTRIHKTTVFSQTNHGIPDT
jgi:hypothetical protein